MSQANEKSLPDKKDASGAAEKSIDNVQDARSASGRSTASSSSATTSCLGRSCKPKKEKVDSDSDGEGQDLLSHLSAYFSKKLGLGASTNSHDDNVQTEPAHFLDEPTVEGIVRYIQSDRCRNVIVMVGAGISTSAGIPDFRSPSSGIYSKLGSYNLPCPEAIFDLGYFRKNPAPFFELAKQLMPTALTPTPAHFFIRLLHDKGVLLRLYTQNIDTLEREAGIPEEKLVEAHGTFHTSHCIGCKREYSLEWMKAHIASDTIPKCERCESYVKPDIVFFGENLPVRFFALADEDFPKCDLLIIIGTSLQVQPFAGLVDRVHAAIPRLLINLEKCGQSSQFMSRMLGYGCGLEFDSDNNFRDVALLGKCDDGCRELARKLGWEGELDKLINDYKAKRQEAELAAKDKKEAKAEEKPKTKPETNQEARQDSKPEKAPPSKKND